MWVTTESKYELMIQDYDPYPVDSEVMLYIDPDDIQVMHKEGLANVFEGRIADDGKVEFLGTVFDCDTAGFAPGEKVRVEVAYDKVDLLDHEDAADVVGNVAAILFKGNHNQLTVKTEDKINIKVDTSDVWDKNDFVGIKILPEDIHLVKEPGGND